jgi:hypothetical protein
MKIKNLNTPVTVRRKTRFTERDEDLIQQEALVFLFMLTRLHDDGTFDDSSEYIAKAVMPRTQGQRRKVSRIMQRLIKKECVAVIEKDRCDPKTGELPMILKPVTPLPIWGGKMMFVTTPTGRDDSFLGRVRGVVTKRFVTTGVEDVRDHGGNASQVLKESKTSQDAVECSCPRVSPVVTATMSISSTDAIQESVSIETVVNGVCTPDPVTRPPDALQTAEADLERVKAEMKGYTTQEPPEELWNQRRALVETIKRLKAVNAAMNVATMPTLTGKDGSVECNQI